MGSVGSIVLIGSRFGGGASLAPAWKLPASRKAREIRAAISTAMVSCLMGSPPCLLRQPAEHGAQPHQRAGERSDDHEDHGEGAIGHGTNLADRGSGETTVWERRGDGASRRG